LRLAEEAARAGDHGLESAAEWLERRLDVGLDSDDEYDKYYRAEAAAKNVGDAQANDVDVPFVPFLGVRVPGEYTAEESEVLAKCRRLLRECDPEQLHTLIRVLSPSLNPLGRHLSFVLCPEGRVDVNFLSTLHPKTIMRLGDNWGMTRDRLLEEPAILAAMARIFPPEDLVNKMRDHSNLSCSAVADILEKYVHMNPLDQLAEGCRKYAKAHA
jgi:hypothetical protein